MALYGECSWWGSRLLVLTFSSSFFRAVSFSLQLSCSYFPLPHLVKSVLLVGFETLFFEFYIWVQSQ
ncbi:Uncharacterised protein [Vibrio cholerae]|nr:Uncharacterised protein [Vibrio cholerae]